MLVAERRRSCRMHSCSPGFALSHDRGGRRELAPQIRRRACDPVPNVRVPCKSRSRSRSAAPSASCRGLPAPAADFSSCPRSFYSVAWTCAPRLVRRCSSWPRSPSPDSSVTRTISARIGWPAAAATGIAIAGSLIGSRLQGKAPQTRLRRGFARRSSWRSASSCSRCSCRTAWLARLASAAAYWAAALRRRRDGSRCGDAVAIQRARCRRERNCGRSVPHPERGDRLWRALFLLGLIAGGMMVSRIVPGAFEAATAAPITIVVAGLLVGFGTRSGNGCTSGHGVCGVSRLSRRSLMAVGLVHGHGHAYGVLRAPRLEVLP